METVKRLFYTSDRQKYWDELESIKKNCRCAESSWQGDYYVSIYVDGKDAYKVWENMDLGVQSEIEYCKLTDAEAKGYTPSDTDYFTGEKVF